MKNYPKEAKVCCPMCEGKGFMVIKSENLIPRSPYPGKQETREIRNKLRKLNSQHKLDNLTLRQIGGLIGIKSAQQIKHHILMLDKIGWDKYEN